MAKISNLDEQKDAQLAQDHVQHDRLQEALSELAHYGGRPDGGVSREMLTDVDLQARRYLIDKARSLGCEVAIDDCPDLITSYTQIDGNHLRK